MKRQFFIAGVQFRPKDQIRDALGEVKVGDTLSLVPEPTNRFDPNAIQIIYKTSDEIEEDGWEYLSSMFLGYVPKKFSSEVAAMIEIGASVTCTVDEVNPSAKTYEMFKVTVSIPVDEEDNGTFEDHRGESER
jgi:hypothetical protein